MSTKYIDIHRKPLRIGDKIIYSTSHGGLIEGIITNFTPTGRVSIREIRNDGRKGDNYSAGWPSIQIYKL